MPRYKYRCNMCEKEVTVYHRAADLLHDCAECESTNSMEKLLSKPLYIKKKRQLNQQVGDLTNQYIEENREILKQQKKEAKNKSHDPT